MIDTGIFAHLIQLEIYLRTTLTDFFKWSSATLIIPGDKSFTLDRTLSLSMIVPCIVRNKKLPTPIEMCKNA